jgi:microcystin-dependent protein
MTSNENVTEQAAMAIQRQPYPIEFRLHDDDENEALYIHQDGDPQGDNLHLEITNTSAQAIRLGDQGKGPADEGSHHFALCFRPNTLSEACFRKLGLAQGDEETDWRLSPPELQSDGTVSLYLLSTQAPTLAPGEKIALSLQQISAAAAGGARGTRVELRYRNLTYAGDTEPLKGYRERHLSIVNRRGRKRIPLHVGFVGSNVILNDGHSPNTLTLRLTNVLPPGSERSNMQFNERNHEAPTKFFLSFDTGTEKEVPWALGTQSQVAAIQIQLETIVHCGTAGALSQGADNSTELSLEKPLSRAIPQNTELIIPLQERGKRVKAHTSHLAPAGQATLSIAKGVSASKGSLLFFTYSQPKDSWEIKPEPEGQSPEWILTPTQQTTLAGGDQIQFTLSNIISSLPSGHTNLYLRYENIPGYWDGQFVCTVQKSPLVDREQKIGIGVAEPKAKLDVKGELRVTDGNVRIGTTQSKAKPHVKRALRVTGGTVKAGESEEDYTEIGHGGVHGFVNRVGKGNFDFRLDGATKMSLTADGKVGIGKPNPQSALDVKGEVHATSFKGDGAVPKGVIVMWYGPPDKVPAGWALCDGTGETPDLRDRFIVGAGGKHKFKDKGGSREVTLTEAQLPSHRHEGNVSCNGEHHHFIEGTDANGLEKRRRKYKGLTTVKLGFGVIRNLDPGDERWRGTVDTHRNGAHTHDFDPSATGGNQPHENRPPYYALCFIMKL